jgi:hypothetical protein
VGILETNSIFATHVRFLNDTSEIDYFKGFILAELQEILGGQEDAYRAISSEGNLADVASVVVEQLERLVDIYTASFSTPVNLFVRQNGLLSQWRAYGANGGIALEFDGDGLRHWINHLEISRTDSRYTAKEVIYGDENERVSEMRRMFREQFGEVLKRFLIALSDERRGLRRTDAISESVDKALSNNVDILGSILHAVADHAIFFKHHAFREEREFRVSVIRPYTPGIRDDEIQFRLRDGIMVPYIALRDESSGSLPLTRIIIGPHREANQRWKAVTLFLARRGLRIPVDISDIPYI